LLRAFLAEALGALLLLRLPFCLHDNEATPDTLRERLKANTCFRGAKV
jgi:hypothetical protein